MEEKADTNSGKTIDLSAEKKHFVLVHGACHGAWCWFKVESILKLAGHRVSVMDMAASGINPKQVEQLESISDYFEPLITFMDSLPLEERVILVGHSYGGLGISKAMECFPDKISIAIFLSAIMPGPTLPVSSIMQEMQNKRNVLKRDQMDNVFKSDQGGASSFGFGPNFMSVNLYPLCPPEDLTLATKLVRRFRLFSDEEISREIVVSSDKYGSVSRAYFVCDEDKMFNEEIQFWMIEKNPTNEVRVIAGSDHMPMFSNPNQLCNYILELAQTYA